jgi:hypothetical protein
MTLGTDRVQLSFNPSANTDVNDIKQRAADCIDWCNNARETTLANGLDGAQERARLLALAMTAFEEAAMWAVKAVT